MDGGIQADDDGWTVAGRRFRSRLVVGTGKYKDLQETAAAIEASGAEIVTVAVRRVNLSDPGAPMLQDYVDPKKYTYLPNTAGCHTANDAVRTLRLAREAGGWNLVKLEVLGPPPTLYPDMPATFEAAEALIKDGFEVMVYCADDPVAAKRLEEMGCVAIMPLGAPIGSGLGVQNPAMLSIMIGAGEGAIAGGCRRGHRLGCRHCDGDRLHRGAAEFGDRAGAGPGADGAGDEARGAGRAAGASGRAHAAPHGRRPVQPADRADPLATRRRCRRWRPAAPARHSVRRRAARCRPTPRTTS